MSQMEFEALSWMSVRSASIALRVSKQRVHQLIAKGALTARVSGGTVLVSRVSVASRVNAKALLGAGRKVR